MKKRAILLWLIIITVSLVLESSVLVQLTIFGAKPDLLLISVVIVGMLKGSDDGMNKGFFIGLLEDVFIGRLIGVNAITKAVIGFLAGQVEKEIIKENVIIAVSMVWLFTMVHNLLYGLLLVILGQGSSLGLDFLGRMLTSAFYNALLTIPLFPVFYHWLLKGPLK